MQKADQESNLLRELLAARDSGQPVALATVVKARGSVPRHAGSKMVIYADGRFAGSVGEPLNPEAVLWGAKHLGLPFHDNWWQTETGGIMIANYACMDIRPGSMGRPLPGIEAGIVEVHDDPTTVTVGRTAETHIWGGILSAGIRGAE